LFFTRQLQSRRESATNAAVLNRLARYVLVAALMVSIGAQWAVLQSAAWVSMAISYTLKTGSVSKGLSQTFDGTHPCKMCCMVKKGTESEKKDPKQQNAKQKLELFASDSPIIVIASPAHTTPFAAVNEVAVPTQQAPPTPPPRCGLA
jgi:hypothetical protein